MPGILRGVCYDTSMTGIVMLFLFLVQQASPAAVPDMPEAPGVYCRQDNAAWVNMKPAQVAEGNTRGLGNYVDTGGYTNLNLDISYRGAKASLRISNSVLAFFVREAGNSADMVLVHLVQKKGQRLCQTSPSSATVENKMGFKSADIVKTTVVERPDKSYLVTPEEPLRPGEYLLAFGSAAAGYDFGID